MTSGSFVFETVPRVVCEDGATGRLGAFVRDLRVTHALLVTDRGLVAAGVVALAVASLAAAGVACTVYTDVLGDPPESCVRDAVQLARDVGINGVIGFGGGSSLDVAKLVALLARSYVALESTYGIEKATGVRWPLVQVPTTAGTGSEVTPIAIVTTHAGVKQGIVSRLLYADLAILDASLTLGLPTRVTAMTGIDAMVHAIEAYTSRHKKNAMSDALAIRALQLLSANLQDVVTDGRNLNARRAMLTGAMLAGMAFANAPVAAVHALAYPLGGRFHVPHGLSNALVLLPVLEFNLPVAETLYAELASAIGVQGTSGRATGRHFVDAIATILADIGLERRLRDVGVQESDLALLASDAMDVQRLLINNPRDVSFDDARAIYAQVL